MSDPAYLDTHTAIVGASGAGKTVTAKDQVEMLLGAGRHVCILDPTGAWWGMRSNAAGDGPGFDIPIFGGAHGDVAITADQGEAIGAIVADGVSAIIDIAGLRTGAEQRRFARDLCRRLRAKPDGNFHFVVDEADEFAAQKPRDDYGFQVGEELIWMAKRGRLPGFVLTLITQRPASIDKEVLSQAQTLIVHQLVAPVDQKPIVDYLKEHADRATMAAIKGSLASLDRGERWIYAPRMGLLERGISPMPSTFDSSRTIGPGEQAIEPKMLAQIDLGAIRERLAPVAEPETGNEPRNMQPAMLNVADIQRLSGVPQLNARIAELEAERDEWIIERGVGQQQLDAVTAENRALREIMESAVADFRRIRPALEQIEAVGSEVEDNPSPHSRSKGSLRPASREAGPPATLQSDSVARPGPTRDTPTASNGDQTLTGPQRHLLASLAWWSAMGHDMPTRTQLAAIAGWKPKGSNLRNRLSELATLDLVEYPGTGLVHLTPLGILAAPPADRSKTLIAAIREVLTGPQLALFNALYNAQRTMTRAELAGAMGWDAGGSNLRNRLSELSSLELVDYPGRGNVRLQPWVVGK